MAQDGERAARVEFSFRCSDAAYERLFRRMPGKEEYCGPERRREMESLVPDVIDETRPGDRFGAVLLRFLKAVERNPGLLLLHPKPSGRLRVRKLWVDSTIKERFDEVAATAPVSRDILVREAIYRFTSKS